MQFYGNEVFNNNIGVSSSATIGGEDWTSPNRIHDNATGVWAMAGGAVVRFNTVQGNQIGIDADGGASIRNNLLLGNTQMGVRVAGRPMSAW